MTSKLINETKEQFCIRLFRNSHREKQFNLLLSNVSKIEGSNLKKKVYASFMLHKHLLYLTLRERMITFSSPHRKMSSSQQTNSVSSHLEISRPWPGLSPDWAANWSKLGTLEGRAIAQSSPLHTQSLFSSSLPSLKSNLNTRWSSQSQEDAIKRCIQHMNASRGKMNTLEQSLTSLRTTMWGLSKNKS